MLVLAGSRSCPYNPGIMKYISKSISGLLLTIIIAMSQAVSAGADGLPPPIATPQTLAIAQIKMTGDEFLVLQNNSGNDIDDLSSFWLQSFNSTSPLAKGVTTSSQQLPPTPLRAGQTLLLSSDAKATCGAGIAGNLGVSLTDGSGFLQLTQMTQDQNGAIQQTPQDQVSWNSGASGVIQNVPSSTKSPQALYYRYAGPAGYKWQLAEVSSTGQCQINAVIISGSTTVRQAVDVTPAQQSDVAPSSIVSIAATTDPPAPSIPSTNIGLLSPEITELLPNPIGTGTDATDEFIELYNPNSAPFRLGGYAFKTGTTITHSYVFAADVVIQPKSFVTYYSEATNLTLSNTGGQVRLVDPLGTVMYTTANYSNAKDGQAWALAKGAWYWTTTPTPSKANVIKQAITTSKSKTAAKTSKSGTTANAKPNSPAAQLPASQSSLSVRPIHGWVVAMVASGALLYGVYEYRADLAHRFNRLRTKLTRGGDAGS
ncbi:MAG: Non specific extracellular endonuclease cleaving [Candidatus Saccharibacteria bacterium]|nr:Non specific extracellular endonuclease cleaving [Candidatus Saccharibacteria bacterium]